MATESQDIIERAGREVRDNPPKILAKTRRKKGAKAAHKQKVAIMLSKVRRAGAKIARKKGGK